MDGVLSERPQKLSMGHPGAKQFSVPLWTAHILAPFPLGVLIPPELASRFPLATSVSQAPTLGIHPGETQTE